ncbi:MAG: IclR family transcriptional regulator [Cryobacterium sp.]|nr:IclR family transcriptional regulator [Cryobacterium sp.]
MNLKKSSSLRASSRIEARFQDNSTKAPAALNTLRIIRFLAEHSGPVRATNLSRGLELPRSTVYQLLTILQNEGFVVHSPEHQGFTLGPLLGEIGSSIMASTTLARLAGPVLERLVSETKLPVVAHLGMLQHSDVVYALKIAATRAPNVVTSVGVRLPAHLTATGRSMLASLPPAQVNAIYGASTNELVLRTGIGPKTVGTLISILSETRARGWSTEDGDIDLAYASVAAAVLDHNNYPAAAVGLTFRRTLADEAQSRRFGRAVAAAASALSRRIRGRP